MINNFLKKLITTGIELTPNSISQYFFPGLTPIFMMHRLVRTNEHDSHNYQNHVRQCLTYIRKHGYQPLSLDEYADKIKNQQPIPIKSVVFTIDDGFYDQYEIGGVLFSEFDIPLTCYAITDFLDNKMWPWDDQIRYILENTKKNNIQGHYTDGTDFSLNDIKHNTKKLTRYFQNQIKEHSHENLYKWLSSFYTLTDVEIPTSVPDIYKPMSWSDAQRFTDSGHLIAPHTLTHRILTQLPLYEVEKEIKNSIVRVKEMLSHSSKSFAYPTGRPQDFNNQIIEVLKKEEMLCAVDTRHLHALSSIDLYRIPRFHLPNTQFEFIQYLSFFEELKRNIRGN